MEKTVVKLIDTFQAKDSSNQTYSIDCYQSLTMAEYFNDQSAALNETKKFKCRLGPVSNIDYQTFCIEATNTLVTRIR